MVVSGDERRDDVGHGIRHHQHYHDPEGNQGVDGLAAGRRHLVHFRRQAQQQKIAMMGLQLTNEAPVPHHQQGIPHLQRLVHQLAADADEGRDDRPGLALWSAFGWRLWPVQAGLVLSAVGLGALASLIDATWGYVIGVGCALLLASVFWAKVALSPDHQAPCHPLVRDLPRTGMVEFIMLLMIVSAGAAPILVLLR